MKLHLKGASFSTDNGLKTRFSSFYSISNHKNFIPEYLVHALTDFAKHSQTIEAAIGGKSSNLEVLTLKNPIESP